MKIICIYKITCLPNGKIYIGSAKDFHTRKRLHLSHLRINKHKNRHLQNAFNLYNEENFFFEIVEITDKKDLLTREQFWLDQTLCYKREIGFNVCLIAGSSLGVKRTVEFKQKIKETNLNRSQEIKDKVKAAVIAANTGHPSWNKGIRGIFKHSEKSKNKIREANKKIIHGKLSPSHYLSVCIANKKPRGEAYSRLRSSVLSKTYYFIEPESGCELKIINLKEFSLSHSLNPTRMYEVAKGTKPHHKGWVRDENCYIDPESKYINHGS